MRIRKRLSGCLPKQLPSYRYCFSTGWLRPKPEQPEQQPEQPELHRGNRLDEVDECKSGRHPIPDGIGEEPRTPPPCYGEKPALARLHHRHEAHHSKKHLEDEQELHRRHRCGTPEPLSSKKITSSSRRRSRDLVKGESSSQRKRVRVQHHHDQQHLLDAAEPPNKNSSHENCGPPQRPDPNNELGAKSISYQQEISRMDPLQRAMHTVVSEAGIEGLTARETSQQILLRGLCSEADIPRSVKMAKAMRESPYLVEISRSSKFVLWSTFLEESSKSLASENHHQEQQTSRRRRRQRSSSNKSNNPEDLDETGVAAHQILELRMGGGGFSTPPTLLQNGVIKPSSINSPAPGNSISSPATKKLNSPAQEPRKFLLDLNMTPQDDW